jgi:hypothetical protein
VFRCANLTTRAPNAAMAPVLYVMPKKLKVVAVDHSERGHSRISPSKLTSFEGCPGYESKQSKELHPVTKEGIDCHEALDCGDWSGLTPELTELVSMCQDYVDGLGTGDTHKEACLNVTEEIWGYCDLILIQGNHAHVVDYKFGWHPVKDAEFNLQGIAYVAGAFHKWGHLEEATVHFLQPRLGYITSHKFTRNKLDELLLRIQVIVDRVKQWDAGKDGKLLVPTATNCVWCSRKLGCPAFNTTLNAVLDEPLVSRDPDLVDPEYLSAALSAVPVVERWIKDVKEAAIDTRVEDGVEIPGFDLVVRSGRPTIPDTAALYEEVKDLLTVEELLECATVSVSKLRDKVASHVDRGQKGLAKSTLLADLESKGVLAHGNEVRSLKKTN